MSDHFARARSAALSIAAAERRNEGGERVEQIRRDLDRDIEVTAGRWALPAGGSSPDRVAAREAWVEAARLDLAARK